VAEGFLWGEKKLNAISQNSFELKSNKDPIFLLAIFGRNKQLIISNKILDVANKEINLATDKISSFENIRQEIKMINEDLAKLTSMVETKLGVAAQKD